MGKHYIKSGKTFFEFENGKTVKIYPVSTTLYQEIQKLHKEPQPPIVTTISEDGTEFREENRADPDYKRAHDDWFEIVNEGYAELMIRLGAVCDDIDHARLAQVRNYMKSVFNITLDEDDNYSYIKFCLMNERENAEFFAAISSRSQPVEGAVMRVLENFSDNVQG